MPLDLPPYPYWTTASFNAWFAPLYAEATAFRLAYPSQHSPAYLQPYVAAYMADGTVLDPLPTGWSTLEFTDWMAYLNDKGLSDYYEYIFSRTPPELIPAVKTRINYGVAPAAPVTLSFMGPALPAGTTLARASEGWALGSTGVLTSYANNVPRFAYNGALVAQGMLNEAAGTNWCQNSVASGAVAGSPGTQPTNWNVSGSNDAWIRTFSNPVVEDGYSGVDVRFAGTPIAGGTKAIQFVPNNTSIPAAIGQTWQFAVNIRVMSPDLAGCRVQLAFTERNAAGTSIGGSTGNIIVPTTAPLRTQRFTLTITTNTPGCAFVLPFVQIVPPGPGIPADVNLRVAQPQAVMLPASSSIVTLGAATVTRAQDIATVTQALAAGYWDAILTRASGVTTVRGIDLTAGTGIVYVPPNDPSPLQSLKFQMSV